MSLQQEIQRDGKALLSDLPNDESRQLLQDFLSLHESSFQQYEVAKAAFSAASFDPIVGDNIVAGIDRKPGDILTQCATFIAAKASRMNEDIGKSSTSVVFWSEILVVAFGLAIIATVLLMLKNSFVTPLLSVIRHIEVLAKGDFASRLNINRGGELGQLNQHINMMQDSIVDMINAVKGSSATLTDASSRITKTASSIMQDTNSTRTSTDQVAAAIHQMSITVQDVASNAAGAADATQDADTSARKGLTIMENTLGSIHQLSLEVDNVSTAMNQLEKETSRIGGVLDVIKNVAEQTNLLALNAAIEAARAGEQGRGFAVVADEVRALAKRTQESTAEIQHIIIAVQQGAYKAMQAMKVSQSKTQSTSEMAGEAGQTISEITRAVTRIHGMNTQIATAAEEQSYAAEEINKNVNNVVRLMQNAEKNAQQSSAIAIDLDNASRQLERQIAHFNL